MLTVLLFLLQAPSAVPAEIVVIGQRLERLRFSARVDKRGRVRCRIKRSSGDRAFDGIACQAVTDCAKRSLRTESDVESCMQERLKVRFAALQAEEH